MLLKRLLVQGYNIQCLSHLTQKGVCGSQCGCGSVSTAVGLAVIH